MGAAADIPTNISAYVSDQQRQRRRRHAVDAAGLADRARPDRGELLARLVGQPPDARVVDVIRQLKTLVTPEGGDVGGLPAEIDIVLGVDLQLLEDLRRKVIQPRPDPAYVVDPNGRERKQLERSTALTISVEGEPVARRLV